MALDADTLLNFDFDADRAERGSVTVEKPKPAPKKGFLSRAWDSASNVLPDVSAKMGVGAGKIVEQLGKLTDGTEEGILTGNAPGGQAGADIARYYESKFSDDQKAADARLGAMHADENLGPLSMLGKVAVDPKALTGVISESLPAMGLGVATGGALSAAGAGALGAEVMLASRFGLPSFGTAAASGLGEGLTMGVQAAADAKENKGASFAANLALGLVTNLPFGGSALTRASAKMGGLKPLEEGVENFANKSVARRTGADVAKEATQETTQEYGQYKIETGISGEKEANANQLGKRLGMAGLVGGVLGGVMHPFTGEGAPQYKTLEERTAAQDAQKALDLKAEQAEILRQASEAAPEDLVKRAAANRADAEVAHMTQPTEQSQLVLASMEAAYQSALDPSSRTKKDTADMAAGALTMAVAPDPDERRDALGIVNTAAVDAINSAETLDQAIAALNTTQTAAAGVSTIPASLEATARGAEQGVAQLARTNFDEAQARAEVELSAKEARIASEQAHLKAQAQAAKEAGAPLADPIDTEYQASRAALQQSSLGGPTIEAIDNAHLAGNTGAIRTLIEKTNDPDVARYAAASLAQMNRSDAQRAATAAEAPLPTLMSVDEVATPAGQVEGSPRLMQELARVSGFNEAQLNDEFSRMGPDELMDAMTSQRLAYRNYARSVANARGMLTPLSQIRVDANSMIEGTNETVRISERADIAIADLDADIAKMKGLLACLES